MARRPLQRHTGLIVALLLNLESYFCNPPLVKQETSCQNYVKLATDRHVVSYSNSTNGMSYAFMPGAREFIRVVMKLIPPSKNATNSKATATSHIDAPRLV